jgi:hypothetical protein
VVFPDPTGPAINRPKAADFMKRAHVGVAVKLIADIRQQQHAVGFL